MYSITYIYSFGTITNKKRLKQTSLNNHVKEEKEEEDKEENEITIEMSPVKKQPGRNTQRKCCKKKQ